MRFKTAYVLAIVWWFGASYAQDAEQSKFLTSPPAGISQGLGIQDGSPPLRVTSGGATDGLGKPVVPADGLPPSGSAIRTLNPHPIPPGNKQSLNPHPIPPGNRLEIQRDDEKKSPTKMKLVSPQIDPPPTVTKPRAATTKAFSPQIDPPPPGSPAKPSNASKKVLSDSARQRALPPSPCRKINECDASGAKLDGHNLGPSFAAPTTSISPTTGAKDSATRASAGATTQTWSPTGAQQQQQFQRPATAGGFSSGAPSARPK